MNIFTYDGRSHISISADKALFKTEEDLQQICDDILLNIDIMFKEVFDGAVTIKGEPLSDNFFSLIFM